MSLLHLIIMISARNIQALGGVLDGVSFDLAPGEYVVLLGANGSGKSTLLRSILALSEITGGTVDIDGFNPFDARQTLEARKHVGYVQQRPDDQIVATSAEDDTAFGPENLGLAREKLRARVEEALEAVGLTGFELREPHTLSGGQKQRLVIAGALAMRPNYLLLDEPTSQLDPAARSDVLKILDTLVEQGTGILHITHSLEEARRAQRVLVLHEGKLVFDASFDELMSHNANELTHWGIQVEMPQYVRADYRGSADSETLSVENVSLTYELGNQQIEALHQVSCSLAPGEFVVVQGATGSGKSSLLSLMAGMLKPNEGTACLGDVPLSTKVARGTVGLIFQDSEAQLFADTVLADVAFGPRNFGASEDEARARATEALVQVGLDPRRFGAQSPFVLSGGEARRVAIAGILALKPRFLLADEPTSALDATGRDAVRKLLAAATAEAGVMVVTHSPEQFISMATRVYMLKNGSLTEQLGETSSTSEDKEKNALDIAAATEDVTAATSSEADVFNPAQEVCTRKDAELPLSKQRKPRKATNGGFPLTIGSYLPGVSILHRADPRTKLIVALMAMVALFLTNSWIPITATCVLVIVLAVCAHIPARYLLRTLRPVLLILAFTLVVNAFKFSPFRFSLPGFERGILFALRIVVIMLLSTLVTLTTSPVTLTDGMTALLKPLRRLRVPVDDLAMMLSIALRFIPTIFAEAQVIIKAQTMRGAHFATGSLWKRLRAWAVILVPLLVQLFRRADTLALAMEARCYTGIGRTRLRRLKMRGGDWIALGMALLACVGLIVFAVLR